MLDLRERHAKVTQAQGELLLRAAEAAFTALVAEGALPAGLVAMAKRRFGEEVRRLAGGESGDAEPVALPEPAVEPPPKVAVLEEPEEDVDDDLDIDDEVIGADEDELDEDALAGDGAEPSAEDAEIPEHALVALGEIPMAFRNRFAIGDEGQHRSRVAWTRRVRAEKAQRAAAEEAAEEADEQRRQDAAAVRAARRADPGPAPSGWGSRGGRGRGPAGERAGG